MEKRLTIYKPHAENSTESTSGGNGNQFEINPLALMRRVIEKRRMIVAICSLVVLATAGYMLLQPNLYTSRSTILPSGQGDNFSSLKAMVGLGAIGGQVDDNSSTLFPVILKSDLVRSGVLAKRYDFQADGEQVSQTLPEYFGIDDPDKLRDALAGISKVDTDARTGEIAVMVETQYPALSQAVLREYINQLEAYNLEKRRSGAKNNELYLAGQLENATNTLEAAEDSLEAFRLRNAAWAEYASPQVMKLHTRFQREVELRSRAYLMLQEQYELAKFEAQKDVPIVRILDQPTLPTQKSGPFRRNIIILSAILSFGFMVFGIMIADLISQAIRGANQVTYDELKDDVQKAFPRTAHIVERAHKRVSQRREMASVDS